MNNTKLKAEINNLINYHNNLMTPINLERLDLDHQTKLNFIIKHCQAIETLQDVLALLAQPSLDETSWMDKNSDYNGCR